MAELRLMENCDIEECTELYLGAFHHDGKMGEYFRTNLPLYFKKYIESDYCMAYVLTDGDLIIGFFSINFCSYRRRGRSINRNVQLGFNLIF